LATFAQNRIQMNSNKVLSLFALFGVVMIIAFTRLIPHPPNLTALGGIAILGGAMYKNGFKALLIPLAALFVSDLVLNNTIYSGYFEGFTLFTEGAIFIYSGFVGMALVGRFLLQKWSIGNALSSAVLGSAIFYLMTNFGAWYGNPLYTQDLSGLMTAYAAGAPFFPNTLLGTTVSLLLLNAGFKWVSNNKPEWLTEEVRA
jgi:hypothetical protein